MDEIGITRSALFVPGNRPDRVDKAVATAADLIIIDLEDAVPVAEKIKVRPVVEAKIKEHVHRKLMVRVNGFDTDLTEGDLGSIVCSGLDSIMLPKVEKAEDVKHMAELIQAAEAAAGIKQGSIGLVVLVETALGVENTFEIASAKTEPPRLRTIAFGSADFCLDMGVQLSKTGEELAYPRAKIAIGCRAAEIAPPLDSPFMLDLKDREAFEADVRRGKSLGFGGKLCIHPNQVDFCNFVFSPTQEEITFARKVIDAYEKAEKSGQAAIQMDGKFIDYPVIAQARKILELAGRIASKE
ncbi:MAG: CoA ester lyase [Desulfobacteraceae bacterium]|nr:CoA ester lyase [Desulfobacteraceae bacterium]